MINLGVIFGGKSTENEVSVKSGKSVIDNLNKEKYNIFPIYIDKDGKWYEENYNKEIKDIIQYLKKMDVVFPVLHGKYGEDGTIQGMLEIIGIPYVGCNVLASSVGMDKVYTKIIFEKAKINQTKYTYIKKYKDNQYIYVDENLEEEILNIDDIVIAVNKRLEYPIFVKPSNSGSSVGVNKSENDKELKENIEKAALFDDKILIEEGILGKEVECAVLGNNKDKIEVSRVGEIISAESFYSYEAKYENHESKTIIPASISEEQSEEIRKIAKKAFRAIDGNGLSRVDFFVEEKSGKIYINEINTMPGFTDISMYPKLMEDAGYSYSSLLDKLIENAIKKY